MALKPGDTLGGFEIVAPLGSGGMGEVYRARDARLMRDVAIKVLAGEHASGLPRFEQEARAASALAHPNIVTIFEIGEAGGRPFLAMELVEGRSVRELLEAGPLPSVHALKIAAQVAGGLAAAHEKGIVHRDLKPENLMVLPDGLVKILDFGLAKAFGAPAPGGSLTRTGHVVGTPAYMSPEQARGGEVDYRSDQFSLGTVLYEMLSGRLPFERESPVQTMTAILEATPVPLHELLPRIPEPLDWLVERLLSKSPRERWASTRDLEEDLRRLAARLSGAPGAAHPTVRVRRRPLGRRLVLGLLAAAAVLASGAAGLFLARRDGDTVPVLSHVTFSGVDRSPAFSPDGRTVAFSSQRDGRRRIWLKQLAEGSEAPLTEGSDDWPRYFPDGGSILFTRTREDGQTDLWRVPVLGGEPRRIVEGGMRGDVAPDGKSLAYFRVREDRTGFSLMSAKVDGSAPREVARERGGVVTAPRFSPDSRRIAYGSGDGTFGNAWILVVADPAGSGLERESPPGKAGGLSNPAWISDRDLLYAQVSSVQPDVTSGRVYVHRLGGRARPILSSLMLGDGLDRAADGRIVLTAEGYRSSLVEVVLPGGEERVLTRGFAIDREPVFSADGGRVVFTSNRQGNLDLWELALPTGRLRRLTEDPAEDWDPHLTRDGRLLLWSSRRGGTFEIWRAAVDGSSAVRVTTSGDSQNPSATADGSWIVYGSYRANTAGIWKVRFDGREPMLLEKGEVASPEVSPDGRWVLYFAGPSLGGPGLKIRRLSDGQDTGFFAPVSRDPSFPAILYGRCRFLPDGRGVAWVGRDEAGRTGVFAQDFVPGVDTAATRRPLAGFQPDEPVESFGLSPDGTRIALATRGRLSNLALAEPASR